MTRRDPSSRASRKEGNLKFLPVNQPYGRYGTISRIGLRLFILRFKKIFIPQKLTEIVAMDRSYLNT